MSFWNFPWTTEATPESSTEVAESDLLPQKPSRGWASVFEGFRDRSTEEDTPGPTSGQHAALRSFTRRAHQLLAKQHQRAWQSGRALALDHNFTVECCSLALAEAEDLDDWLRQTEPSREDDERLSGWSTSASSGSSKASDQLLSRWDCESELRQALDALQSAKSQAASELRSQLRRLKASPGPAPRQTTGAAPLQVLARHLPQLAQSCADSLQGDDDWATAEAQLLEDLVEAAAPEPTDPDFVATELQEILFVELPSVRRARSEEEQRDQTALQNLLLRIERLSQRMEQEAGGMQVAEAQTKKRAKDQRKLFMQARRQLESQVQQLVEENQALEAKLEAERAKETVEANDTGRREKKLSPAERLALSNRGARPEKGAGGNNVTFGPNSTQIFGSQRRVLKELRKELAETYEVLALRSLSEPERQMVLARRARQLQAAKAQMSGKVEAQTV